MKSINLKGKSENYLLIKNCPLNKDEPEEINFSFISCVKNFLRSDKSYYRWWLDCNLNNIKDKNMFYKKFL